MKNVMILLSFLIFIVGSVQAATEWQCNDVYSSCVTGCNIGSGGYASSSYFLCVNICRNNRTTCLNNARNDYYNDPYIYDSGYGSNRVTFGCSPEVVVSNVSSLDKNLSNLAQSTEFASAQVFKGEVSRIALLPSTEKKINSYFALIGIDGNNVEKVVDFLSAREPKPEWISNLKESTKVSDYQAKRIIEVVTNSLVGERQ